MGKQKEKKKKKASQGEKTKIQKEKRLAQGLGEDKKNQYVIRRVN